MDSFADACAPVDTSFVAAAVASGTVRFTPSESAMHQAALELYGLAMSVRAASSDPRMRNKRFRVRVDAMVTVWYFKNSGGRSGLLNKLFRFLWELLRAVGSTIVDMVHVPCTTFVAEGTDLLSRPPPPSARTRLQTEITGAWNSRGSCVSRSGRAAPSPQTYLRIEATTAYRFSSPPPSARMQQAYRTVSQTSGLPACCTLSRRCT